MKNKKISIPSQYFSTSDNLEGEHATSRILTNFFMQKKLKKYSGGWENSNFWNSLNDYKRTSQRHRHSRSMLKVVLHSIPLIIQ